jgi:hypothetical protein
MRERQWSRRRRKKERTNMSENNGTKRPFVITRGSQSGVHAGELETIGERFIVLRESRRIWYWEGAASLSEIAVYGCAEDKRKLCLFAAKVDCQEIATSDVCEIIHCQPAGEEMIRTQPEWRAARSSEV